GDLALVARLDQRFALGAEHRLDHLLVGERPVLVAVVLDLSRACRQATLAVLVEAAHALDGVLARPVLLAERIDPRECRLRRDETPTKLLVPFTAVVADAERADQGWKRQALD